MMKRRKIVESKDNKTCMVLNIYRDRDIEKAVCKVIIKSNSVYKQYTTPTCT